MKSVQTMYTQHLENTHNALWVACQMNTHVSAEEDNIDYKYSCRQALCMLQGIQNHIVNLLNLFYY